MFKRAEKIQSKLKGALTGPSGAGKTYSALLIASGLGSKIALLDTENSSASLYADLFQFDTMVITPPYSVDKYVQALKAAENAGYDVLVIDSISHAWAAEGGLLSKKESLDARGGNSFANWGQITKEHEVFKAALLNANIHLLCTMRSKQDYVLETNDKGKSSPRKVGLAPIQRDGMEYEFTFVLDLAMNHEAQASKDRTGLFDGKIFKPSKGTGETLQAWLAGGKKEEPKASAHLPVDAKSNLAPPKDELFEIGKEGEGLKGTLFSAKMTDKKFLLWVNEKLEKDYAKTHDQLKRFHSFCRVHGAFTS